LLKDILLDDSAFDSGCGKQQDLEDVLVENYELNTSESYESGSDNGTNEEREKEYGEEEDEGKHNEVEEYEGWEKVEGDEYNGSEEGVKTFSHSDTDEVQKGKAVVHQVGEYYYA
jgi:hypothetical protein